MLTVPLRVEGKDAEGNAFECAGRTITVSRYGARMQTDHPLTSGQKLRLTNLINQQSGNFCVVGLLEAYPEGGGEWGVASTEDNPDMWGILFPASADEPRQPKALLECHHCHAVGVIHLSQVEIEVLEEEGLITRTCESCKMPTPWGYAVKQVAMNTPSFSEIVPSLDAPEPPAAAVHPARKPRFAVQRPISISTSSGQIENVLSENASKAGICFTSERFYEINQEVTIIWPHGTGGHRVEARGRIVRKQELGGTKRKIYGIHYELPPVLQEKKAAASLGLLYAAFWICALCASLALAGTLAALFSGNYTFRSSRTPALEAVIGLLFMYLVLQTWKRIQTREPEDERAIRKKHRIAVAAGGSLILVGLAAGSVYGIRQEMQNARFRIFLRDLTSEELLESRIDGSENQRFSTPQQYMDSCVYLDQIVRLWSGALNRVSDDAVQLDSSGPSERAWKLRLFLKVMDLEYEKVKLLGTQVALANQMRAFSPDQQLEFWNSKVLPLRDEETHLRARKRELVNEMAAR